MLNRFLIICLILIGLQINNSYSQGCSDAGFCTINSLKPEMLHSESLKNKIKLGVSYGKADNSVNVFGNYLEFSRQFNKTFGTSLKLTSLAQSGNDISKFDISDLFISTNIKTSDKINFTAGIKIPFNKANKSKNNLPLPMDYQSSLGTFDLILGAGVQFDKLQISVAAQIPLNQNENKFIASEYPTGSKFREFNSTNNFERSTDVLLRITYPAFVKENFNILVSILPIYHLSNDKFTDLNGIEKEIGGSKGLTLNGNVFLNYNINKTNSFQLNIGFPFVIRDERPDGLTRSFITNLEYSYNF